MDKRYQVFVSSTFQDLQIERQEVMQALLELDCIPAGMELFPAANEDQWTLIKKVIDDCDYYIVVIAGRYGSIGLDGISYTEMEYRYAIERKKPIIAFLHSDPGKIPSERCEADPTIVAKLEAFRGLAKQKLIKQWSTASELGSVVSRSVVQLIKSTPAMGWVRADQVLDENSAKEMLKLKGEIEFLTERLNAQRSRAPEGTEDLAHGEDAFIVSVSFAHSSTRYTPIGPQSYTVKFGQSWNEIFAAVSPVLIDEASEVEMKRALNARLAAVVPVELEAQKEEFKSGHFRNVMVADDSFQTIKVQLRALGLIEKSVRNRSVKDKSTYYALTEYGDSTMNKLRAVRKSAESGATPIKQSDETE